MEDVSVLFTPLFAIFFPDCNSDTLADAVLQVDYDTRWSSFPGPMHDLTKQSRNASRLNNLAMHLLRWRHPISPTRVTLIEFRPKPTDNDLGIRQRASVFLLVTIGASYHLLLSS